MSGYLDIFRHYQPKPIGEERRYAVLLPLVWNKASQDWQILYQVRSKHISQPGEVSFPGGRVEKNETFYQAALRETVEELNVTTDNIEILGEIDYLVHHHRTIRCFVGIISGDWHTISPNPDEVERLFVLSLSDLLATQPKTYNLIAKAKPAGNFPFERIPNGQSYDFGQDKRKIPFYDLAGENLWGLTAQFTARFIEIIQERT
ncbi:NUDIX hydrolase [Streptococcus dentasini]